MAPPAATFASQKLATGELLIVIEGELDVASADALRIALTHDRTNVIVDLSQCTFLDSSALGALIDAGHALRDRGQLLVIVRPANAARRSLELGGVDLASAIVASRDDAVARCAGGGESGRKGARR